MGTGNGSLGEGIFLRLSHREAEELYAFLKDAGFSEDAEGVKAFLFDSMDGGEDALLSRVKSYVEKNPEAIRILMERMGGAAKLAASFFLKRKTPA